MSDAGQDDFIISQFPVGFRGVAIECGANDGVNLSNTTKLEQVGWQCILIEPRADKFAELTRNRPNAMRYNVACSCREMDQTDFLEDTSWSTRGTIEIEKASTIDRDRWAIKTPGPRYPVKVMTLDKVCEQAGVNGVDALILDVDGPELDILRGFDLARWRPKIIVMENDVFGYDGGARHEYLLNRGYWRACNLGNDGGYVRIFE